MGILCLGARIGTASECTGNRPNPRSSTSHKDFGASVHFYGSGVRRPSEATQLPVVSTADGLAIKQRNSGDELAQRSVFLLTEPESRPKRKKSWVMLCFQRPPPAISPLPPVPSQPLLFP